MLLAIDVGNTNMVFGLYDGDKLRGSFRISTNSERTSDELGMLIAQYYHFHDIACADTTAVVIASVVPPVMYTLINAIRKYLFVQPVIEAAMRISALKTAMPTRARSARTDWSTRFLRFASTASRSSSWISARRPPLMPSTRTARIRAARFSRV